jgi:endonuclease/exonuclease/phosphatase family metal-dependent hydrolase
MVRTIAWGCWASALVACSPARDLGDDEGGGFTFDTTDPGQRAEVRVATWNVEALSAEGSEGWLAARDVLRRLDADVVLLNEIDAFEARDLSALADELGYPTVEVPTDQPFGSIGNAVLSRLPVEEVRFPTSAKLSGDRGAEDQTRLPAVLVAQVPGADVELTVVGVHLKSGFEEADLFRRAVDGHRAAQAAASGEGSDLWMVMGDFNEDLADSPQDLPAYHALPAGLPFDYALGDDLAGDLNGAGGLVANPFAPLEALGLTPLAITQRDGSFATRPTSGRRIDYVWLSDATRTAGGLRSEVYSSALEATEGIADGGDPLSYNTSNHASDHLPLLVSFTLAVP